MSKKNKIIILIISLMLILSTFFIWRIMNNEDEYIEEIKVAIESTEEEAAGHLSTSMEFTPIIDDTGKQNLKYQWELIKATEERLSDGGKWSKKVVNDGGRVYFSPMTIVGFNKDAPIAKTITVRLTVIEDGKKIGSAILLLDDHDGYYIIRR